MPLQRAASPANSSRTATLVRTAALACAVFFAAGLTIAAIGPGLPVLAARIGVAALTMVALALLRGRPLPTAYRKAQSV